jgi:hypothetical protein
MSTSADLMVARADYDRRLELAGVDLREQRHHADRRLGHGRPTTSVPLASHPLAAFVARLVGRPGTTGAVRPQPSGSTVTGRPRHP